MKESTLSRIQSTMPPTLLEGTLPTALAPMQDVTHLPFMKVMKAYGVPDYFFTEYFRVYPNSILDKHIVRSITESNTGRPVYAQLLGNSLPDIRRIVGLLKNIPIAGVDLNVGCPAPKIYKNHAGGGLLRNIPLLDSIIGTLRDAVGEDSFSIKIRLGFDNTEPFEQVIALAEKHRVDFMTIHARTVAQSYRGEPDYSYIGKAVEALDIPVFANGNITSPRKAAMVVEQTNATGVMIGRSAIRNPWIFRQIREHSSGQPVTQPKIADVYDYIKMLYEVCCSKIERERSAINHLKKYANFIGQSVDPKTRFIKAMRRCHTEEAFFGVCKEHLLDSEIADTPFPLEPYTGVVARPNCEDGHVVVPSEPCKL
jgi:tRNA-dihydrouridine synthase B